MRHSNNKPLSLRVIPSEHFLVKCLKATFDLSGILGIIEDVKKKFDSLNENKNHEWSNGTATIIYGLNKKTQTITLVTGWIGNRKKKEM